MQNTDWVLLKDLAPELGIQDMHVARWGIWTAVSFRPTRIKVKGKTGVLNRWAVTTEQAERLRELCASALVIS